MSTDTARFDPARPYRLAPSVAVRPEPFGALLYDYGTRRLSFLKTPDLVRVVRGLAEHDDVAAALTAAHVPAAEHTRYLAALTDLAATGTIEPRRRG
ncbi:mycofactocin biosynthesis chaperone MftB [Nocardia sp. CA2R105]|uniref:mycofactocin biosynthesis chaperone MftB n=1 Tax=Nocardia coffeae TaxID=2873381 RepID=UPI001CA708C3|nr:mycofactocin biosynthesis chaperone MftB [Nocardia coffeae]MBY8862400.1 mycofactocin biosynthesis chaperone MftB [Nocardia coffeae]